MTELLFWLSSAMVVYTYFGYPVLILILSKIFYHPVAKGHFSPKTSVIISVFNEEKNIQNKIMNLLEQNYPKDKLEIIIGSDGSTDKTKEIIENYLSKGIIYYELPARSGKPNMLNHLLSKASGDIIVFADARQLFEKNAIQALIDNFADESVGCVSGELILEKEENSSIGKGLSFYWNYEKIIRRAESDVYSMIGATGAIYAVRKSLCSPVPSDIILDDVYIPMKVVEQGFRAVFETSAKAFDEISKTPEQESQRKIRTIAGNWQLFMKLKKSLNPFTSRVAVQFISHKLLRVVAPYLLILIFCCNIALLKKPVYQLFFYFQLAFFVCAVFGSRPLNFKFKLFVVARTFMLMNFNAIQGLLAYLSKKQKVTWVK